jgi:menaquinone-dependent protoporphyrinogen oxidase
MTVLVAYASRHGATKGIAERIARVLTVEGVEAESRSVSDEIEVAEYDAFVIGGAAYMFHWLKGATEFVTHHRTILAQHPVWLFSSGPVGTELVDKEGRDVMEVSRPKEWERLEGGLSIRGDRVFFGAWDPSAPPVGVGERFLGLLPKAKAALPAGDFRDWEEIEAWAVMIASELRATT